MHGRWLLTAGIMFFGTPLLIFAFIATMVVVALWFNDGHHGKVPGDAKPSGFEQLARWNSCGADGDYCWDVIMLGGSKPFETAVSEIEVRYQDKGYSVRSSPVAGTLYLDKVDDDSCIMMSNTTPTNYSPDLAAPDQEKMEALIAPYPTAIEISEGPCP